jgi:chemotaxis protein MotB
MKKKHEEHVNLERWLVSYADFITMMFAFFVVLWATSRADAEKFAAVAQSLKTSFGDSGAPYGMIELAGTGGGNTLNPFETIDVPGGRIVNLPAGRTHVASDPEGEDGLQGIRDRLEDSISLEMGTTATSEQIQMQYDSRGLVLTLSAKDFFQPFEIEVRPDLRPLLDRVARVLVTSKRLVRIEGHSDASEKRPDRNASGSSNHYPSSWELSAARAGWVARYWLERFDFDPKRLGIAGYAHYRPVADGSGDLNLAANRRIEIIVLNTQYETETLQGE